jgi:AraC-like DNA-binding protein
MSEVLNEITPLSDKDFYYLVDRRKERFNFPAHKHKEYELNFIERCEGAVRVVGDSVEKVGEYELVLIGGGLEHYWEQGKCRSTDMREVTIQFDPSLFSAQLATKSRLEGIAVMLERAKHGLAFSQEALMRSYSLINELSAEQDPFEQFLKFLRLLYLLSKDEGARELSSVSFVSDGPRTDNSRVMKVKRYIDLNYAGDVSLPVLADIAGMTPPSLSRFFRMSTGRTVKDYIAEVRLGAAARLLVDTQLNIADICERSGYGNLSNFNRIFKARRGLTPKAFRELYKHNRAIV